MKFREHRGGLAESLATTIEVNSIDEIKNHLNEYYNWGLKIDEIKFEYLGMDDRTGWDTYYVLQRFVGEDKFTVAGMSDGEFTTTTLTIELPPDARSPFIENGNELNWYVVSESSSYDSMKLPQGKWKIIKWDEEKRIVYLDKK